MGALTSNPEEIYTALASVTDKTGLLDFMRTLKKIEETQGRTLLVLSTG